MGSSVDESALSLQARHTDTGSPLEGVLPAWQEIDRLFQRHGLQPPPYRLRDELVMHLLAYREAQR